MDFHLYLHYALAVVLQIFEDGQSKFSALPRRRKFGGIFFWPAGIPNIFFYAAHSYDMFVASDLNVVSRAPFRDEGTVPARLLTGRFTLSDHVMLFKYAVRHWSSQVAFGRL